MCYNGQDVQMAAYTVIVYFNCYGPWICGNYAASSTGRTEWAMPNDISLVMNLCWDMSDLMVIVIPDHQKPKDEILCFL